MRDDAFVKEVRGDEIRCSGTERRPHDETTLFVPPHETIVCPFCGQKYRRASLWNIVSGAIWPKAK
ncbi:hypothetical protein AADZ90_010940 [Aestuariibius sp. 2305UL40-4]|uniref:hypothetical protein n=1 Tax=Aestuariibius violaceus TaxID=3234132 RepID=UPI00345EF60A